MAALRRISETWTWSEALTHTRGRHTLKAGMEIRRSPLDSLQQTNARGSLTFRASTGAASTGYTFADFLMGLPASSQEVPVKVPVLLRQDDVLAALRRLIDNALEIRGAVDLTGAAHFNPLPVILPCSRRWLLHA